MRYHKTGTKFRSQGKTFAIGGRVLANKASEYAGLNGTVLEILTGKDRETENGTTEIYVAFDAPETPEAIAALEKRFSALYQAKKTLDDITLDMVVMAPDMLEPVI